MKNPFRKDVGMTDPDIRHPNRVGPRHSSGVAWGEECITTATDDDLANTRDMLKSLMPAFEAVLGAPFHHRGDPDLQDEVDNLKRDIRHAARTMTPEQRATVDASEEFAMMRAVLIGESRHP